MQVDTEFKLKDIKETSRVWEGKTEGCKRELKELSKKLQEHIEQSVPIPLCAFVSVEFCTVMVRLVIEIQ